MTRRGLSLLEVIIAIGILAGSAALLSQMVDLGTRHIERAERITEAQALAHNLLNEMIVGTRPWQVLETPEPVDAWSAWDYRVSIDPVGLGELSRVTITVEERRDSPDAVSPNASAPNKPAIQRDDVLSPGAFRLVRWVRGVNLSADPLTNDSTNDEEFGQGSPSMTDF